jgi:hypothetical protein
VTLPLTRTYQGGQLLYATVLPLAPDESKVDPEFGRLVRPLRDQIRARGVLNTGLQGLEQKVTDLSGAYLEAKGERRPDTNAFCQKMAIEACLNRPWEVLPLAARKFLLSDDGRVSIGYDEPRLQEKLNVGFNRKEMLNVLAKGLVGRDLADEEAVSAFVLAHYRPFPWYPFLDDAWATLTVGSRGEHPGANSVPPLPAFFILALAGMAIALAVPGPFQRFHIAWILCLSGLWFAVELTGVVNPRYRYVFEPFCLIYAIFGLAVVGEKLAGCFHPAAGKTKSTPTPTGDESMPVGRSS